MPVNVVLYPGNRELLSVDPMNLGGGGWEGGACRGAAKGARLCTELKCVVLFFFLGEIKFFLFESNDVCMEQGMKGLVYSTVYKAIGCYKLGFEN